MDLYSPVLREFLRLVFERWFKRIEEELQFFAEALDQWLHDLFGQPTPDWRESFDQFLAEQEAQGRMVALQSRQDLLDFLEGWATTVDWSAVKGGTSGNNQRVAVVAAAPESVAERPTQSKNWPALTPAEAESAQRSTGLPWWYPVQPRNRTDSVWQKHFEDVAHAARDLLLDFFREAAALGRMSRALKDPGEADVERLLAQHRRVQEAYDRYIRAKIDIYREWTRYLSIEWLIGPEVLKLFRKIDNALPDRAEGLKSSLDDELKAARRTSYEATDKKVQRTEAAYTALVWTDNVITVIEIATLVGSAKAVFTETVKKMAAKGLSRAAARSVAVAFTAAHLATAAASAAVIGGVVPKVLVDAGLDEADVRAGLAVFRALFTLVGLRAVAKGGRRGGTRQPGGRASAEDKAARDFLKHIRMREGKAAEAGRAYPHSQVFVRRPDGKGYWILDNYDPTTREIVSFKDSQLASVKAKTAIGYLDEFKRKYPPGRIIADVPSNSPAIVGEPLRGRMILEVPVQKAPIPTAVLDKAKSLEIQIRDVAGRIY